MRKNEIKHKFYLGEEVEVEGKKTRIKAIKARTTTRCYGGKYLIDEEASVSYQVVGSNLLLTENEICQLEQTKKKPQSQVKATK